MKQYLSIDDIPDVDALVKKALTFKKDPLSANKLGIGKSLLLLFSNPSLRTRLSTEMAGKNLGMRVTTMDLSSGWKLEYEDGITMNTDKAEHIQEAARVVSQYADIIGFRSFPSLVDREKDYQDFQIQRLANLASKPIINMESAIRHPLQALADLVTIMEHSKSKNPKVVLSWAPHPKPLPQAVANSFINMMRRNEMDLVITHPKGMDLAPAMVKDTPVEYDQFKAFKGADFVYTKSWSSYSNYGQTAFLPDWMVDKEKMKKTNQAKFMHCLPVRRNVVVADDVIDSADSVVISQANNRTYAAQAILSEILSNA